MFLFCPRYYFTSHFGVSKFLSVFDAVNCFSPTRAKPLLLQYPRDNVKAVCARLSLASSNFSCSIRDIAATLREREWVPMRVLGIDAAMEYFSTVLVKDAKLALE